MPDHANHQTALRTPQEETLTRLGLISLIPFAVAAAGVWLSPWALPQRYALDLHVITLAYAGVVAVYIAGVDAGARLAPKLGARKGFASGMAAALAVWIALLQGGVFYLSIGAVWRYLIILGVLIFLLRRDLAAIRDGLLPKWYGALRMRLTFWMSIGLVLIMSRLLLWGYY